MKKTAISLLLVLALVLCVVLATAPTTQATDGFAHDDSPSEHLETDGWKPLTAGGQITEGGKYYIAEGGLTLDAQIEIASAIEVTICLNGNKIDAQNACQTILVNHNDAVLNICDCQGGGSICNGESKSGQIRGGNLRITKGTVNLYSGTIEDGESKSTASSDGLGGNVFIDTATAKFYMYGGTIQNGYAKLRGGNISVNKGYLYLYGGTISGGNDSMGTSIWLNADGYLNHDPEAAKDVTHAPLDAVVASEALTIDGAVLRGASGKNVIKLYSDMGTPQAVEMNIGSQLKANFAIDLNGNDLNAKITNSQAETNREVFVLDSTTDNYDATEFGVLTYEVVAGDGEITMGNIGSVTGAAISQVGGKRYVALPEGDGYTFHRIYVGVESVSLEKKDDGSVGMGYTTAFKADTAVKNALAADSEVFGITIGLHNDNGTTDDDTDDGFVAETDNSFGKAASAFVAGGTGNQVTLRVNNILSSEGTTGVAADIRAETYLKLNIGGAPVTVTSKAYVYSLQDVIDALYAVENLETQHAAAAELLAFIKSEYSIEATPAPAA